MVYTFTVKEKCEFIKCAVKSPDSFNIVSSTY